MTTAPAALALRIENGNLLAFTDKLIALQRRAAKLGLALPEVAWAGTETTTQVVGGRTVTYLWHLGALTSPVVAFAGWSIVAAIDTLAEGAFIVRAVRGVESKPEWTAAGTTRCDHCKAARRRAMTVVVRHEDGRELVLGTDCLADFAPTNGRDPANLAAYFNDFLAFASEPSEPSDNDYSGGRGPGVLGLAQYLPVVAAVVEKLGFVSSKAAYGTGIETTASTALTHAYGKMPAGREADRIIPSEKNVAEAKAAVEWAAGLTPDSDYLRNIQTFAKLGWADWKHAGYVASIVAAYQRELGYRAERAREAEGRAVSAHVGTVGERLVLDLELVRVQVIENDFGTSWLHLFVDGAGNRFKWFSSSGRLTVPQDGYGPRVVEPGEKVTVKATVKGHDEYKGTKQTNLSRVAHYTPPAPRAKKARKAAQDGASASA